MPQNLALNVAEKGFTISVYNRSGDKTDAAVARAKKEGVGERLHGEQHSCDLALVSTSSQLPISFLWQPAAAFCGCGCAIAASCCYCPQHQQRLVHRLVGCESLVDDCLCCLCVQATMT